MTKSQPLMTVIRAVLLASTYTWAAGSALAQSSSSVTVDLSAIDSPAPAPSGRIVLRPPTGTAPINTNAGPVKLRAPERAAAKPAAPKPTPAVAAKPAEPVTPTAPVQAAAAPTPSATAPTPRAATLPTPAAPPRAAATPAPTPAASAPRVAEAPKPAAAPTPPPAAPPATTVPSAAAARSAQQEPVGPVASPMPTNQQSAALPPSTRAEAPSAPTENVAASLTIPFAAGVTNIDVSSQGTVKDLAQRMSSDKSLRVQLMAYATDPDKNTSKARRLSLDRAVAIRNMLIEAGVERTRIEVRALGDQGEGGSLDRVDAVAIKR